MSTPLTNVSDTLCPFLFLNRLYGTFHYNNDHHFLLYPVKYVCLIPLLSYIGSFTSMLFILNGCAHKVFVSLMLLFFLLSHVIGLKIALLPSSVSDTFL